MRPLRPGAAARRALVALAAVAAVTAPAAVPSAGADASSARRRTDPPSDLTMVQANIYTGLTPEDFQADVRKVLSLESGPDFVTYNEVPFRKDGVMAPAGRYGIYRDMENRFTAATPVAWRLDRWTEIDHGTWMVSDHRGKPPGRQVELGRRYANWVTLQGTDGRVLSVVSAHVAPKVNGMPDLVRPSVQRLGMLVDKLAPRGPVLMGGDFNVHYKSSRYPRDILAAHDMVPTYDTLGNYFPTGDHKAGATIDYVFDHGVDVLTANKHYPVELNSDHDAVVAGFAWQTDAPASFQTVSTHPRHDPAGRRDVLQALRQGIGAAEPGATVEVATHVLDQVGVTRSLKSAVARGVHVRVVTSDDTPTVRERRLARAIAASQDPDSWMRSCVGDCLTAWAQAGVPKGFLLVGRPDGTWQTRYDVSRNLVAALVERSSTVQLMTGKFALADGEQMFDAVDGADAP